MRFKRGKDPYKKLRIGEHRITKPSFCNLISPHLIKIISIGEALSIYNIEYKNLS